MFSWRHPASKNISIQKLPAKSFNHSDFIIIIFSQGKKSTEKDVQIFRDMKNQHFL